MKILRLRNRYNGRKNKHEFEWLNVLVLTNRIDWLDQFRDDIIHWREWDNPKPPFLSEEVLWNMRAKTFHSKADNLNDIDRKYWTRNGRDQVEDLWEWEDERKDTLFFSTFQTAILKDLPSRLPYIDLIIIDESHNVKWNSEYADLLTSFRSLWRDGREPMVLPVTATPTNVTKDLFWESAFTFWLSEYLASPYSPDIDYKLITSSQATSEQIEEIRVLVEKAKRIEDLREKRRYVSQIEEAFTEIMAVYPTTTDLVTDLLDKRIWKEPDQTIIYANTIDEADAIAKEINRQSWSDIALSYHSANEA